MAHQHDVEAPIQIYTWHPKVACRTLEGTAFVLSGSRMVSLNDSGSRVWALLEQGTTPTEIAEQLAEEYEVSFETAVQDAQSFIQALVERQMVIARPATPHAAPGGNR